LARRAAGRTSAPTGKKPPFTALLPAFFLIALVAVAAYSAYMAAPAQKAAPRQPEGAQAGCRDGLTKYCTAGNCSGISVCVGGMWGGCRWEQSCTPGSTIPCLSQSCPYAVKECNGCGTGYGPCRQP
jgi:hypothetical protein